VTAQREPGKDWYGWRVSYAEPYRVELPEAEAMVTVLRRIDRGMRRLAERYGSPADLAAFMSHLADVLGCRTAAFGRRVTAEHDFDGTGYRWMDADALRYWLGSETRTWDAAHGTAEAPMS
jgi:hypothetical protein